MSDPANNRVNLAALQRVDPYICEILDTASQVALYKFDPLRGEWERTDIEGALFVYQRSAPPSNGFIIMNRLNTTNQIEPLTKDLEFKKEIPYLLYKNAKMSIYGIWFYEGKDYARISDKLIGLLGEVTRRLSSGRQRRASESDSRADPEEETSVDILTMLLRAQERFTKSSGTADPDRNNVGPKNMVDNLRNGDVIKPKAVRVPGTAPAGRQQPFVFGNNTVASLFANAQFQNCVALQNAKSVPPPFPFPDNSKTKKAQPVPLLNPEPFKDKDGKRHTAKAPCPIPENGAECPRSGLSNTVRRRLSVDEMLTPAMIELAVGTEAATSPINPMHSPPANHVPSFASLMSPMMFVTPSKRAAEHEDTGLKVNPLTKDQLAQSLIYLLKNDDEFVGQIHRAYVTSLLAATGPNHRH